MLPKHMLAITDTTLKASTYTVLDTIGAFEPRMNDYRSLILSKSDSDDPLDQNALLRFGSRAGKEGRSWDEVFRILSQM